MKSGLSIIAISLFSAACILTSCDESPYIPGPGDNSHNPDGIPTLPAPEWVDTIPEAITVAEARKICRELGAGGTTKEKYYVKGWVQSLDDGNTDAIYNFGNAHFMMADVSTGNSVRIFEAYQVYGKDGRRIETEHVVKVGDYVVVYGPLTNYGGTTYETVGRGAAHIYASSNPIFNGKIDTTQITPDPIGADVPEGTLNVYQANALCATLENNQTTAEEVYVKGYVRRLHNQNAGAIENYGNAQFYIAPTIDDSSYSTFYAYQVYGKDKKRLTDVSQVQVGDFVVIKGKLTNYNGTYETVGRGQAYIYYSTNPNW